MILQADSVYQLQVYYERELNDTGAIPLVNLLVSKTTNPRGYFIPVGERLQVFLKDLQGNCLYERSVLL
ncbi:MAG: hypothetical protein QM664_07035 [Flavihumibacter sp.]